MFGTLRRKMLRTEELLLLERLPLLIAEVCANGYIAEALLQEAGFSPDLHSDDRVAPRDYGITAEGRQRAKVLTHDAVKAERAAAKEAVEQTKKGALELAATKVAAVLHANIACEEEVLRAASKRTGTPSHELEDVTVEDFYTGAKVDQLRAFIKARGHRHKGKPLAKGNLSQAIAAMTNAGIAQTLASMSFRLRASPATLQQPGVPSPATDTVIVMAGLPGQEAPLDIMRNKPWMELVQSKIRGWLHGLKIGDEVARLADSLIPLLRERLEHHIQHRVMVPSQRNIAVGEFFTANLPRICTAACMFQHVRLDAATVHQCASMITSDHTQLLNVSDRSEAWQGCYLFIDPRSRQVARSGKVSGGHRPFGERLGEHAAARQLTTAQSRGSRFYLSYPPNTAQDSWIQPGLRKGHHEDVTAHVGMVFTITDAGKWGNLSL